MKVAIVGSAYPLRGGLAAYNERLATEFQHAGHEVTIHTFSLQYPSLLFPGKSQYSDGPPPKDLNIEVDVNTINPLNWYRVGKKLAKAKYDLVIFKFWIPFVGPSLGTIAKQIRKNGHTKVITILDNVIPHEARIGDKAMTSYFLQQNDGFIAMSQSVLDDLKQFQPNKPVELTPHPLFDNFGSKQDPATSKASFGLGPDTKCILFFGFIREYKGLDLMLKAFADERLSDAVLLVAGEYYTDAAPYQKLIKDLGIENRVQQFTDFIPNEEVARYFSAADLVVQPYKDATQSGITQIAYHFEVPMVVTNVGGLAEIVPDGKAGYVVEPDPERIADAMVRFYEEGSRERLQQGIAEEKKRYSWDVMLGKILALYKQCI